MKKVKPNYPGPAYRVDIDKQNYLKEALIEISKKISKRSR